jgi:hypothetical protein
MRSIRYLCTLQKYASDRVSFSTETNARKISACTKPGVGRYQTHCLVASKHDSEYRADMLDPYSFHLACDTSQSI